MSPDAVVGGDKRSRNEPDYDAIYREFEPKVRALVRRRLAGRGSIEDVVQETFIRAFRALPQLDLERPLWPWLRTVCVNVCTDVLRAPRTWVEEPTEELPTIVSTATDPAASVVAAEQRQLIADALDTLAPRQREILLQRVVDGASTEALAASDGSTLDAVKSAVKRGRHGFRQAYQNLGSERGLLGGAPGQVPVPWPVRLAHGAADRVRRLVDACVRACNTDPVWQNVPVFVSAAVLAFGLGGVGRSAEEAAVAEHVRTASAAVVGPSAGAGPSTSSSPTTTRPGEGAPPNAPPGRGLPGDGGTPRPPPAASVVVSTGFDDSPEKEFHIVWDIDAAGMHVYRHETGTYLYCDTRIDRLLCEAAEAYPNTEYSDSYWS